MRGNVEDGARELRDLLDRFNEPAVNYSEDTADVVRLLLQDKIDAADAWQLDTTLEIAMDALRLPPGDADVTDLSGGERRRVALCRLLLAARRPAAARRAADHLDAESVARLEKHLEENRGTVVAVTHDRYFLDNVAGWILELDRGRGGPLRGNDSSWLDQARCASIRGAPGVGSPAHDRARAGVGWRVPEGAAQQVGARLNRYEALIAEERNVKLDQVQIHIPPARDWAASCSRPTPAQGLRRPAADRGPVLLAAPRRGSSG